MKRKRTEKSKYKHISTGDYCTCAAYVAEVMCMKMAEYQNVGSLPYKFWNNDRWKWTFLKQSMLAREIIKTYPEQVLVKAISSDDFKGIFSLNNPRVPSILKKYNQIFLSQQDAAPIEVIENATIRKTTFGKKNSLNKLRTLDNGKKG